MSRRDTCLISNYEEAKEWLAEFKHTITDEQVLKVVECLMVNASEEYKELQITIANLDDIVVGLESDIEELEKEIKDLEKELAEK